MNIKIVTDSSSDIWSLSELPFESAPLKIITTQKEYIDTADLNVYEMVEDLYSYKGKITSSCPNCEDWLNTFGDAERIICVTLTSALSGSYNAALLAKRTYEEANPDRKVFVLDSFTAGPEIGVLVEKAEELALKGTDFEDVCEKLTEYKLHTGSVFMLESMKNLANNGRVSMLTAKMAGILGIRAVGTASEEGDFKPFCKCRGEAKSFDAITTLLKSEGYNGGKMRISHCFNEATAKKLKSYVLSVYPNAQVEIGTCSGLCSFYAEKGGMLIGFEKNI